MSLLAALAAAGAAWCLVPPASPGLRRLGRRPGRRVRVDLASAVLVVLPLAGIVLLGPVVGLVVGLALVPPVRAVVARMETSAVRRRREQLAAQLPPALDLVVAALDAGRPPALALAVVAETVDEPLRAELSAVAGRLEFGDPVDVWAQLGDDSPLAPVGRAFRRAGISGAAVARVVQTVADELRRERRAERRERARRVGVRTAAPLGLCFLPAFFLVGVVPTVYGTLTALSLW